MFTLIDHKGKKMFSNDSLKVAFGYAYNRKKPTKEWCYIINDNGDKIIKF